MKCGVNGLNSISTKFGTTTWRPLIHIVVKVQECDANAVPHVFLARIIILQHLDTK